MTEAPYHEVPKDNPVILPPHASFVWRQDPIRFAISLARYKFVARMLEVSYKILEIGCADGFGTELVARGGGYLTAVDVDQSFIDAAQRLASSNVNFYRHDMLMSPFSRDEFDAFYALDVLEHISPNDEEQFLHNAVLSLKDWGVGIVGVPSQESQVYASDISKLRHVNCKTKNQLWCTMRNHFHNVFIFSMNDEVVHTGFGALAHYRFALCTGPIK